jgi:hypothetical protein
MKLGYEIGFLSWKKLNETCPELTAQGKLAGPPVNVNIFSY